MNAAVALAVAAAFISPLQAQETKAAGAPAFVLPALSGQSLASLNVEVKGFRFQGNTVFSTTTLQALVADTVGQQLDPSALDEVRNRINRFYIDAGYLNSGALFADMPPGGYAQGIVPVQIIEGRVQAVHIRGLGGLAQHYVQARLLRDDEPLNIHRLQERFRLLLADPLFDKINSRIVPGDAPGTAVLDIDVQRARPFAIEVFTNNYRPPSVGSRATGVHAVARNLTGLGDAFEATLQHTQGGDPMRLAWSATPLTPTVRASISVDRSVSTVVEESLAAIDIKSRSKGSEAGASYALVDTLARRVEMALAYGRRRAETTLLGQPFSFTAGEVDGVSEVRAWRFSQDWTERWEQQALAARSVWVMGTNNVDPAAAQASVVDPASVPARRYFVWTGQVQHVRTAFGLGGELRLRGNAQVTRDRLLPLAQFAVGGMGSVRGYRENAVLRDRAIVASAESRQPLLPSADAATRLTLLTFIDLGAGANTQGPWQRLSSVGAGASWQQAGLSADLTYAKRLNRLPTSTRGDLQDRGIQFQLSQKLY